MLPSSPLAATKLAVSKLLYLRVVNNRLNNSFKHFDGYDNYQSSDEQISVSDVINECYKFSTFLTNLYYNELEKN